MPISCHHRSAVLRYAPNFLSNVTDPATSPEADVIHQANDTEPCTHAKRKAQAVEHMANVSVPGIVPREGLSHAWGDQSEPALNRTIGDALRAAAEDWGERTALVDGGTNPGPRRRWSYAGLLQAAEQVARALLERFSPGEHVAICAANSPE